MGTVEYVIWHAVGYAAMPAIFLIGFAGVAAFSVWLLSMTSDKNAD